MGEFNIVLRSLRTGRSPGPDGIVAELLKGSPYIFKLFLLDHFNHCLSTSSTPDSWALSEVVMIVKKAQGDTRDLFNYRPISLTNTMYRIFASLIQIKPSLLSSMTKSAQLSSDSEQIDFGIPPLFQKTIFSLYSNPRFRVRDAGRTSPVYPQTRGLRQGCPLLPYLFHLVLTHLFDDVEIAYTHEFGLLAGVLGTPFPFWHLEYADDTTLLSNSAVKITRLLHLLQHQGAIRGLHLNFLKCAHLKFHSTARIPFSPKLSKSLQLHKLPRSPPAYFPCT